MNSKETFSFLNYAKAYAQYGLPVFPCEAGGKKPLTKNGFKDATKEINKISDWWSKNPSANIGIPTGSKSRIMVLDIDKKSNGLQNIEFLLKRFPNLDKTLKAKTGGGGIHMYFAFRTGFKSLNGLIPGVDFKAEGGYVIAPPSIHESGDRYEWINLEVYNEMV